MNKKKSRISVKVSLYIAVMQVIVMLCMFAIISFSVSKNIKETTIDNMQTISTDRARIIEDYVRSSEEFLTAYSRAGEIVDVLSAPADGEAVEAAQKYTETFSADREYLEGIYACEWNSHVLVHTNPAVPGMIMREGDSLKALQESLLSADGVYNTGIFISPASGEQVISMYRVCYDSAGEPAGFVGGAIFTTGMFGEINGLPKKGLENSRFYLINAVTGEYIYHDDQEKTATVAEEGYIANLVSRLKDTPDAESGYMEYQIGEEDYLASYYYMADKGWVFVMEDSREEIFASSKEIEMLLLVICALAAIGITVLSFILLMRALKPLIGINRVVNRLGEGDISDSDEIEGYVERTDEIGQISKSVKHLQNHLKDIVFGIIRKAEDLDNSNQEFFNRFTEIHDAISGINNAVEEIALGATGQAQETLEAERKVKAIADEINHNSENVVRLDSTVSKTTDLFENMVGILDDLTGISDETINSISEVAAKTQATNRSSDKIKEAVDLIKNITSQTNLLSLNASIEAARAGEAGKGFAVVATEISQLAAQSSSSAEIIKGIIDELVQEAQLTVSIVDDVSEIIGKQKDKLHQTSSHFHSLERGIESSDHEMNQIRESASVCETARSSVNEIVISLSAISQENAASAEETTASMLELNEMISRLVTTSKELIGFAEALDGNLRFFRI